MAGPASSRRPPTHGPATGTGSPATTAAPVAPQPASTSTHRSCGSRRRPRDAARAQRGL